MMQNIIFHAHEELETYCFVSKLNCISTYVLQEVYIHLFVFTQPFTDTTGRGNDNLGNSMWSGIQNNSAHPICMKKCTDLVCKAEKTINAHGRAIWSEKEKGYNQLFLE